MCMHAYMYVCMCIMYLYVCIFVYVHVCASVLCVREVADSPGGHEGGRQFLLQ